MRAIVFGNSGAGKSTYAKSLSKETDVGHLDLDTIAWNPTYPPTRRAIEASLDDIQHFMQQHQSWVMEGCYADLLEKVSSQADTAVFLNLSIEQCVENAKSRPWEPHKYQSKEEQDANLDMLIDFIRGYEERSDTFCYSAHRTLFDQFEGEKVEITRNQDLL